MNDDELQPDDTSETRVQRQRSRPRAERALPTDRLKFATQVEVLKAFASARDNVSSEDLARLTSVSAATAGLNNVFFTESGLIQRVSKGRYRPDETVLRFAREYNFAKSDTERAEAARLLAPLLQGTWYYAAVVDRLDLGPATRDELVKTLARVAGAELHHRPQLDSLLDWLVFVGLLTFDGDAAALSQEAAAAALRRVADDHSHPEESVGADEAVYDSRRSGGLPDSLEARPGAHEARRTESTAVLSLTLDLQLSADDIGQLAPDQIRALFEAVGSLASLKVRIGK